MITPMLKHLRRRHFDLAFLLGLAIFGTAYYLSIPRPLWTHTQPRWTNLQAGQKQQLPSDFTFLGFSEDDLSFYTCHDHWSPPGQPAKPMIHQWEAGTGKLVKSYPFQIPEKDQLLIKEYPHPVRFLHSSKVQAEPPNLIFSYLNFTEDNDKLLFRMYQLNDGACLGDTFVDRKRNDSFSYLVQNPEDGHHLAVIKRNIDKAKSEARVTDLATGNRLHTFEIPSESFWKAMASPNGRFLILLFMPLTDRKVYLEVYRMHSWEKLGRYDSPQWFSQLAFLDDTHWVIKSTILNAQQTFQEQLHFYQFDPEAKTLMPNPEHPLHRWTPNNAVIGLLHGNYFYTATYIQPLSHYYPFLVQVEGWLKRIGIEINRPFKVVIREYDLHTGRLLRQQSGIPLGQYIMSNRPSYLANVNTTKDSNNQDQVTMSIYAIPHYLWETTLSWLQWLSWFLILPWPLRYFIPRRQNSSVSNAAA